MTATYDDNMGSWLGVDVGSVLDVEDLETLGARDRLAGHDIEAPRVPRAHETRIPLRPLELHTALRQQESTVRADVGYGVQVPVDIPYGDRVIADPSPDHFARIGWFEPDRDLT